MKQEGRNLITITDNETVTVPNNVKMSITEIADLFGIYYQTAKKHIRTIEKSGIATWNYSMSSSMEGMKIYPDYYGLEMILALAFQIQSRNAQVIRKWILSKAGTADSRIEALIFRDNIFLN